MNAEFDFLENPPALAMGSDGSSEPPDGMDSLLLDLLVRKACIPRAGAVLLLEEVMLLYFRVSMRIENPRGWLVAATCNAARQYHATHPDSALAASSRSRRGG